MKNYTESIRNYYYRVKNKIHYIRYGEKLKAFKKLVRQLVYEVIKIGVTGLVFNLAAYLINFKLDLHTYTSFVALYLILDKLPKYWKEFK